MRRLTLHEMAQMKARRRRLKSICKTLRLLYSIVDNRMIHAYTYRDNVLQQIFNHIEDASLPSPLDLSIIVSTEDDIHAFRTAFERDLLRDVEKLRVFCEPTLKSEILCVLSQTVAKCTRLRHVHIVCFFEKEGDRESYSECIRAVCHASSVVVSDAAHD